MFVKEITVMSFENYFPLWNDLNTAQKKVISDNLITRDVKKGTIIHNGNLDCTGLLLVKSGQLRTYILSDEGREIMQGDVSFTFLDRIEEVELNIVDRRWQSALALALTLPDICGGIAFPEIVKHY